MKPTFVLMLLFMWCYSNAYTVTIYGVDNCGYTTDLRNECSKNNIQFTYCNVNTGTCMGDMVKVVMDNNLAVDGVIYFPIVKIVSDKTYGLCRPSVDKIEKLIKITSIEMITVGSRDFDVFTLKGERIPCDNMNLLPTGIYIIRGKGKYEGFKFIKY
jgi:hypothetical protein